MTQGLNYDCDNVKIENNYVHHVGIEYLGCVGIFMGFPRNSVISHNEVAYVPYVGIFSGWGWFNLWRIRIEDDPSTHTKNENNKYPFFTDICYTVFRYCGLVLTFYHLMV